MNVVIAQLAPMFMHPALAAAGAAAVSIPIIIHLLTRLRRQRRAWGAMQFLLEAFRRHRNQLRIEQWLLLLLRCLVVLILGLALAQPWLSGVHAGLGTPNRLVCLVLDDSLSTHTTTGDVTSKASVRFERLRTNAIALVDGLHPEDRVCLWRVARPIKPALSLDNIDHAAMRKTLEDLKPRHGESRLVDALGQVATALTDEPLPVDHVFVVVLSDMARDALQLDDPPSGELEHLGERATILIAPPSDEAANVQIARFTPRRHVLVESGVELTNVTLDVALRRMGDDARESGSGARTPVNVTLSYPREPGVITQTSVSHEWQPGQREAQLQVQLPLSDHPRDGDGDGSSTARSIVVKASIEHDALDADNYRHAVVEVRHRLRVGVVDESAPRADEDADELVSTLAPARWLSLVLAPQQSVSAVGPIELVDLSLANVSSDTLRGLDAVFVLRPDRLDNPGWAALSGAVQRGAIVWIWMSSQVNPDDWGKALTQHFELPWQLGLEPIAAREDAPWQLDVDHLPPDPLSLLASDWPTLLRPVRIMRRVDLQIDAATSVWLRTEQGIPWVVAGAVGDGRVILATTALDTQWTNLPTKPLFVPLMHETLRGLLGTSGDRPRLNALVCGDQPELSARFEGAQRLTLTDDKAVSVELTRVGSGLRASESLDRPGVYKTSPGSLEPLAINVSPTAADTRTYARDELAAWFNVFDNWRWLSVEAPADALEATTDRANIGRPLLWALLALILVEAAVARWFSHAYVARGMSLVGRAAAVLRGRF
ncbi:MAG: BatA domain-containing protein [Phycisphaeraceae bacterium]|nr:BatA domain-containing protein [Phycisphaeraceae bacterium]